MNHHFEKENLYKLQKEAGEYIDMKQLQMGTNRRQYETYEEYIERMKLLIKLKQQASMRGELDPIVAARDSADISEVKTRIMDYFSDEEQY